MRSVEALRAWARAIKRDTLMLWFASRNPATPWLPKAIGLIAVAYALSPIDLIPDFIPVLGLIDDAILLPGLIWLAVRMLPKDVLAESRTQADRWLAGQRSQPRSYVAAVVIVGIWLGLLALGWYWFTTRGP